MARLKAKPSDLELAQRILMSQSWFKPVKGKDGKIRTVIGDKEVRLNSLITGGETHPDALQRIQAITKGWKAGGGEGNVETNLIAIFKRVATELIQWEPGA